MTEPLRNILVTGANGFIGSHLTEALLARGYQVRCMVRQTSDLSFIQDLPVELAYADMGAGDELDSACQDVDAICHVAALTRALDQETFLRVNTRGTEALAQASLKANNRLQRFLFVSSQAAAGPSQGPRDIVEEERTPQPITWYGKSKWAAEQALARLTPQLPLTVVRPCPVFGPRERDFFSYFDLIHKGLSLNVGREERRLSLIYIKDLIDLIIVALESECALGETYFACGYASSYSELSRSIARAMDKRPLNITIPEMVLTPIGWWSKVQGKLTGRPALLNDQRILDMKQRTWLCSGQEARRELGFEPSVDFDTAVQETADWYRENGWL